MTGDKFTRAEPVAAAAENGLLKLIRSPQNEDLLDELSAFPHGAHDDCVDALSGAYRLLTRRGTGEIKVLVPRGRIPLPRITAHPDSFDGFGAYGSGSRRVGDW